MVCLVVAGLAETQGVADTSLAVNSEASIFPYSYHLSVTKETTNGTIAIECSNII